LLILLFIFSRNLANQQRHAELVNKFTKVQKKRKSRIIAIVHRQEPMGLLGIPMLRYIDLNDAEDVLEAIRKTPPGKPLEFILHTPGGLVLPAVQIARAIKAHPGKKTVFVPHYAMSGGTLIALAALIALASVNIDLTVFAVLSGAIGVGIGFGLQKVVSNFISGIVILLDRSIKPGDTISLGETFGWIRELRARFVSVVTRDGREYLIPNEDFITQEVINWSFSDDLVRLDVPFGVAYSSDPHEVTKLAIEAAKSVRRVVDLKEPVCWLTEFGDSSLNFLLRFWISDPQNGLTNELVNYTIARLDFYNSIEQLEVNGEGAWYELPE